MKLTRLQTNLTILNKFLLHLEFEENGVTIPAFSKTDIDPYWINLYKFPSEQIEIMMIRVILRLNNQTDDNDSIKEFLHDFETEMTQDPDAFTNTLLKDEFLAETEHQKLNEFNRSDDENQLEILDQALLFHLGMAMSFNYISIMMNSLTIYELLYSKNKPSVQDIYKAVKVDKCLLFHDKCQKEIAKQQFDGNDIFFGSLARSVQQVKFKTDRKVPRVFYAYAALEREGYIVKGKIVNCTAEELLDVIKDSGFYFPNTPTNSVDKFRKHVKKYYLDKKYHTNNSPN